MTDRNSVISSIEENRLIAIVRGVYGDELKNAVRAMYEGGIRLCEITFDRTGTVPDKDVAADIAALKSEFGGRMHIGAGTVCTETQLRLAYAAGAEFIVSPDTYEPVIRETRRLGLVSLPGAFTPTECAMAARFGADYIKLFPCFAMSPEYVKSLMAPLSDLKFLAVGGITPDNAKAYLDAGVCGIAVSGGLVNNKEIKAGEFDKIKARAEAYVSLVR